MYVYILETQNSPKHYYVGLPSKPNKRLAAHNSALCAHTKKFKPWQLKNAFWFNDFNKAQKFERYLKSSSGRAFTKKHF